MGVLPGVADFCFLGKERVLFLEIKTEKGRLSENQQKFISDIRELGHETQVAYGWDEIQQKVEDFLEGEKCA